MPLTEENENMGLLERQIEALLFVSPQPVSAATMADHLGVSLERVERAVAAIKNSYAKGRGLTLLNLAGGWQMATAPDLADTVESFSAYLSMQRITMAEIEEIRSVRCDRVVETLLKNGLIDRPRRENKRKSLRRYRTTNKFLEIFGLSSISALPTLEELREDYEDDEELPSVEEVPTEEGEMEQSDE